MKGQNQMTEIVVDGNETGRTIFINGIPDLLQVPQDVMDCFAEKLLEIIMKKKIKSNGKIINSGGTFRKQYKNSFKWQTKVDI